MCGENKHYLLQGKTALLDNDSISLVSFLLVLLITLRMHGLEDLEASFIGGPLVELNKLSPDMCSWYETSGPTRLF